MSCDCEISVYHLESTAAELRRDIDNLKAELAELKGLVADDQIRRKVLSNRVDAHEIYMRAAIDVGERALR